MEGIAHPGSRAAKSGSTISEPFAGFRNIPPCSKILLTSGREVFFQYDI